MKEGKANLAIRNILLRKRISWMTHHLDLNDTSLQVHYSFIYLVTLQQKKW